MKDSFLSKEKAHGGAKSPFVEKVILKDLYDRAHAPNSSVPRAFLRWAGSKRLVLKFIIDTLPRHFRTYREPFLGSGALFFLLNPGHAVLSDTCADLVQTYEALRDNVRAVERHLKSLDPDKETFYFVRGQRSKERFKRAAEFIYLNKTCWNGLYRVNLAGTFNVPFGRQKTRFAIDSDNLSACSNALRGKGILLNKCDFDENIKEAKRGDLVYLDPPYVTGHNNNGFIEYNEVIFSWEDQKRLADAARQLSAKSVNVIVNNANHREVIELYKGFEVKYFSRTSTLASDIKRRRTISEVVLFSRNRD